MCVCVLVRPGRFVNLISQEIAVVVILVYNFCHVVCVNDRNDLSVVQVCAAVNTILYINC